MQSILSAIPNGDIKAIETWTESAHQSSQSLNLFITGIT